MAWISVHEQIIGGKLRSLAKKIGCSQNEALGMLVRFWLWGINNAGKDGRIVGADKSDLAEILNIGIDKKYDSDKVVDDLIETNWIDMEEGLYIHDWEEWQEQWYKALDVRQKDAARKREERSRKRKASGDNNAAPNSHTIPEKDIEDALPTPKLIIPNEEESKSSPVTVYAKDFEEFWSVYPRKVGKGDAYKKYQTRLKDGWSPPELLEAARNYADVCARKKTEKEYIKHPKTFLSDTTPFADYIPKKESSTSAAASSDDDPYGDWR